MAKRYAFTHTFIAEQVVWYDAESVSEALALIKAGAEPCEAGDFEYRRKSIVRCAGGDEVALNPLTPQPNPLSITQ